MEYLDKDMVSEVWGEEFAKLATNPRIKFTNDSIFVELKKPVKTVDGETKTVEITEPSVSDLKATDTVKGEITKSALLLSSCAGIPGAALNTVRGSDFILLNKVVAAFLADGPETGKT